MRCLSNYGTAHMAYGQAPPLVRSLGRAAADSLTLQHTSADPLNLTAAVGPWAVPGLGSDALCSSTPSRTPPDPCPFSCVQEQPSTPESQPRPSLIPRPRTSPLTSTTQPMSSRTQPSQPGFWLSTCSSSGSACTRHSLLDRPAWAALGLTFLAVDRIAISQLASVHHRRQVSYLSESLHLLSISLTSASSSPPTPTHPPPEVQHLPHSPDSPSPDTTGSALEYGTLREKVCSPLHF